MELIELLCMKISRHVKEAGYARDACQEVDPRAE